MRFFFVFFRRQVDAIQMGTHNIYFYKEVEEKYTVYNLAWLCAYRDMCGN